MKKILLVILILFVSTASVSAYGVTDDLEWNELNETEKQFFALGIAEGLNLTVVSFEQMFEEHENPEDALEAAQEKEELITGEDVETIIQRLDEYFDENKDVSVLEFIIIEEPFSDL